MIPVVPMTCEMLYSSESPGESPDEDSNESPGELPGESPDGSPDKSPGEFPDGSPDEFPKASTHFDDTAPSTSKETSYDCCLHC